MDWQRNEIGFLEQLIGALQLQAERDGNVALRCATVEFLYTEKHFQWMSACSQLIKLKAYYGEPDKTKELTKGKIT